MGKGAWCLPAGSLSLTLWVLLKTGGEIHHGWKNA